MRVCYPLALWPGINVMDRYIALANIAHFQDLLTKEHDLERRRVIESLLALEQQKLKILDQRARDRSRQPFNQCENDNPPR